MNFLNFFVFATYVFYCFFYMELFEYWISINISDFNCNESKYCILELKMEFWHKKPFSICFVHKSRKKYNFEPTLDYIMLRNFGTVCPIFPKIAPKFAQDFKEKSHESSRCGKNFPQNYRAKPAPPPPPALLGLRWLIHPPRAVIYCLTVSYVFHGFFNNMPLPWQCTFRHRPKMCHAHLHFKETCVPSLIWKCFFPQFSA